MVSPIRYRGIPRGTPRDLGSHARRPTPDPLSASDVAPMASHDTPGGISRYAAGSAVSHGKSIGYRGILRSTPRDLGSRPRHPTSVPPAVPMCNPAASHDIPGGPSRHAVGSAASHGIPHRISREAAESQGNSRANYRGITLWESMRSRWML